MSFLASRGGRETWHSRHARKQHYICECHTRSVSTVGCVLAAVWALSPLGGQASLRIMTVGPKAITNSANFDFLSAENSYADWHSGSGADSLQVTAAALYLASLTGPQKSQGLSQGSVGQSQNPYAGGHTWLGRKFRPSGCMASSARAQHFLCLTCRNPCVGPRF
jgi:hypothetical protein